MSRSVTAPAETPDVVKDSEHVIRSGVTAFLPQAAMAREMRRR
jgi:hypothetical protein